MNLDPTANLQTHDTLGRKFTVPLEGGPVSDMLNLTIGEAKTGNILISLQTNDERAELDIYNYEDGLTDTPSGEEILNILRPIIGLMEQYRSNLAYYVWYETFVAKVDFTLTLINIKHLLDDADWEYVEF